MTREEAAIVSAYTGFLVGDFAAMHEYAERVMGRPIFTHLFADEDFEDELREAARPDFVALVVDGPPGG